MRRLSNVFIVIVLIGVFSVAAPHRQTAAQAEGCFTETGKCIAGSFLASWKQNGGLGVFGFPITTAGNEANRDTGKAYLTQWFERNRFEHHPENPAPYDVLLGRLGDDRLRRMGRNWQTEGRERGQREGCLWFEQTGHNVCNQAGTLGFRSYWETYGLKDARLDRYGQSLALFGLPLTEPRMERNSSGDTVLTQWFERARFEWHPNKADQFKVLLGLLGNEIRGGTSSGPPPAASPTPQPTRPPAGGGTFNPGSFTLALDRVTEGFAKPTHVTHAGDGSGRLFVVEKAGRIRVVAGGALRGQPFLDITDRVGSSASEQGLFSVAFHPRYRENGLFFVDYTDKNGDTVISKFRVSGDANVADVRSETVLLNIKQLAPNHNGGQLAFGRDGFLYIGMGDGGGSSRPRFEAAQSLGSLLGKMLRIDVDRGSPYAVPQDNPFVGQAGARGEIWAVGLRNPWRFSFDRATGDLFIADVGEVEREEVHFTPAGSRGGQNYGWPFMEGSRCFRPENGCRREGLEIPIADYDRSAGNSITGGFRYRGRDEAGFGDAYFFGDFGSGRIFALARQSNGSWRRTDLLDTSYGISSFGEDERGELYLVDFLRGTLYRMKARPR